MDAGKGGGFHGVNVLQMRCQEKTSGGATSSPAFSTAVLGSFLKDCSAAIGVIRARVPQVH
jgi:hypothetical protein